MNIREFSGQLLVRAAIISIEQHVDWPTANKLAAKEIAAAERQRVRSLPKASKQSPPAYTPTAHGDDDYSNELATAKDRLFAKLTDYFRRHDANVARELAAKRAAKRAERAARRLAKANPTPARPSNVIPMARPDASQPEAPAPEFAGPLVYGGVGVSSAVRLEDVRPSPATAGWRRSIEVNEQRKREGIT
jgi:hypothetical protein